MTEPMYGGVNSQGKRGSFERAGKSFSDSAAEKQRKESQGEKIDVHDSETLNKLRKAATIAMDAIKHAKQLLKPDVLLLEIAEKTEERISDSAKMAFPVDLSINEIAAHYSPLPNDKSIAKGIVKIDLGVEIDGYIVDFAESVDLTETDEYSELIKSSKDALHAALRIAKHGIEVKKIGEEINKVIASYNFNPIKNLFGHEMRRYNIHAGLTIPNFDNNDSRMLGEGVYAIEPFSTTGEGIVKDGGASGVYHFVEKKIVRDALARQIIKFIEEEYKTLPFSSRWIIKKFGQRSMLSLNFLEKEGAVKQYSHLVEKTSAPVSQAEKTIIVRKNGIEILGED